MGSAGRDELACDVATSVLAVVEGAEEPLRVGLDPVRREGALVGLVPGPHVGLDEVGAEADRGVAVPDQVVDGRDDAGGVVRRRRRRAESVDHVAGEGDGLAGGLESIEIVALRRRSRSR